MDQTSSSLDQWANFSLSKSNIVLSRSHHHDGKPGGRPGGFSGDAVFPSRPSYDDACDQLENPAGVSCSSSSSYRTIDGRYKQASSFAK